MKKQYFIFLSIACISVIFNVKAQNTPIDDFLKTYPTREGVTHVSMSQQMLQSIFSSQRSRLQITGPSATSSTPYTYMWRWVPDSLSVRPSATSSGNIIVGEDGLVSADLGIPEAYSSVSVSKKDISENLYADFKKTLLSTQYELFMEKNSENNNILGYYLKKTNDNTNEIVVLHQQKDQFSAIYIKGDIDINNVNQNLNMIRNALNLLGANQNDDMIQFAFAMPRMEDIMANLPDFSELKSQMEDFKINLPDLSELKNQMEEFKGQFDNEDFKQKLEETMKNFKDVFDEDFHRKIRDIINENL